MSCAGAGGRFTRSPITFRIALGFPHLVFNSPKNEGAGGGGGPPERRGPGRADGVSLCALPADRGGFPSER